MKLTAVRERVRDGIRLLRPSGPMPPLSGRDQIFDVVLALSLLILAILGGDESGDAEYRGPVEVDPGFPPGLPPIHRVAEPFLPIEHEQTGWSLVMFLVVLPLVFRRRFPLAMLWVVLCMAPLVSDYDSYDAALRLSFYACVIAAYSAAVYSPYRILALASLPIAALIYTQIREPALPTVPDDAVPFLILIPIAVAATGLRRWKHRADERHEQLSALEREQAEALRRAAEHERARIARELHDVVTHNVSVMVIQAGAARKVMEASPDQAREALLAVEAGGRAAMAELRHVMGLLTMDSDGPDPAATSDLTPQPGLDRLEALVQRVRDTGIAVDLTVTGEPRPLLPGVELTAYRVVQEALTNTVKHAAGASAEVVVDYRSDRLRVEVTDGGGKPTASAGTGNGHGLIGLRERLAVYGGELQAGRRISGGYRVTALIPLEAP
ncbi:signal transduction histidine kinase [Allocatelliglobosispora scoriae]|uniref:histidine kinase n=1 Tax=Allocatelliglobosispora scoriae TaxID=643052 RepID=A0A841C308_9ACTN|nr:sensor histidine kinase [Allocatelliglobosispora scoriae]MBB5874295.1 signal transduction histidine kinase [Allocatelliglobosispora scoriae]